MDFQILYTPEALADFEQIIAYTSEYAADASSDVGHALLQHIRVLARFPQAGPLIRKRKGIRKLLHSPYRIYYRVDLRERTIQILRIWHTARRVPKL